VQPGVGGGAQLAREAEAITVLDVYRAVEDRPDLFALHTEPCRDCDIGGNIRGVLHGVFCRAHEAMQRELGGVTIADVFRQVTGRACRGPAPADT
jgi:DNA-binding IscR family transcriptional regulator